jgi:hypothetical protein
MMMHGTMNVKILNNMFMYYFPVPNLVTTSQE